MSSTDLDPNISINALIVSPDAVDEVTAALAQEQLRADKVAAVAFLSDLAPGEFRSEVQHLWQI